MEEGLIISQWIEGVATDNRNWKSKEKDPALEPPEGAQLCHHLDFGSMILISNFWAPELCENKFLLF